MRYFTYLFPFRACLGRAFFFIVLAPALSLAVPNPIPDPFQGAASNIPPAAQSAPGTTKRDPMAGVSITWYGQACFGISDKLGHLVLTDPFGPDIGYPVPAVAPNVVTVSHEHFDHNNVQPFSKTALVIRKAGETAAAGIIFKGVPSWHDSEGGKERGPNLIFTWKMGGLRIAHLGDLGQHHLTKSQLTALRDIDILLIPVGGVYTINGKQALDIVKEVRPSVVIPMHYKTKALTIGLEPVGAFLQTGLPVQNVGKATLEISPGALPARTTIEVLDYASEGSNH